MRTGVARLPAMLAEPELSPVPRDELVTAAGYFNPDHRFSPATNADRVSSAQDGAAGLPAEAMAADFDRAWHAAQAAVEAASPDRVVRTRHGDLMRLSEFLRTRVLELAVHGLDLAAGLNRDPWLTPEAAGVVADLMLPAGSALAVRKRLGWDDATLIAKITDRLPITPDESSVVEGQDIHRLALG